MKKATAKKPAATSRKVKASKNGTKRPVAADYARWRVEVEVDKLKPAPWNPRREITPESVADLAASIRTVGLVQPLVAMMTADGGAMLIAGHRRLVAAKVAGLDKVPCDILCGVDEATARRMTFIENLQRRDADPLLESELVARLVADGRTVAEIAAETGRGEKWVARRINLAHLSEGWRQRVASGERITTDCLEHIAAYPAELQEKMAGEWDGDDDGEALRWADVESEFDRKTRDLSKAKFDCAACRKCPRNSGNAPDLFDWADGKPAALGTCLDSACYERKRREFLEAEIAAAESSGVAVVRSKGRDWSVSMREARDERHCVLYVWEDWDGEPCAMWGTPKAQAAEADGSDAEARRVALRRKKAENAARRKLAAWCRDPEGLAEFLSDLYGIVWHDGAGNPAPIIGNAYLPFALCTAFGVGGWRLPGCDTSATEMAVAALAGRQTVPASWLDAFARAVADTFERNPGNAVLVMRLWPNTRAALTDEERWLLVADEEDAE